MTKYIDANYLLYIIGADKNCAVCNLHGADCDTEIFSRADICDIIEDAPAVDVQPIVHGHWKREVVEVWKTNGEKGVPIYNDFCSICNTCGTRETDSYCSNCGAKMDQVSRYVIHIRRKEKMARMSKYVEKGKG